MTVCVRCRVTGRVQGVWYRASTREKAMQLELSGYAKNLADGSVEVLVCGEQESVALLSEWLWQGPPAAKVSGVLCEAIELTEIPRGFTTG